MPTSSRLLGLLALLIAGTPGSALADPESVPTSSRTVELMRDFWDLVSDVSGLKRSQEPQQPRPQPRTIEPSEAGGPSVELDDLSNPTVLDKQLRRALRTGDAEPRLTIPGGAAWLGDFSVGSGQSVNGHRLVVRGDADIYGRLQGNLVTLDGDIVVHQGGLVSGDVLAVGGKVREVQGEVGGEARQLPTAKSASAAEASETAPPGAVEIVFRRAAGVMGVFLTLGALGFGLVMFGRPNLEIVSDTVSYSFGRAFVTGLLGQIMLLPTFGMLVVGLILSVAGILLLPFAVIVYCLLVVVGALGGYLAVAHAMGETYIRRRMAMGEVIGSPNSYRYLLLGLGALASLWLAWALFGWVPVAGNLIRGAAFLVTWLLATAGFGAALLSRAGVRENFAGRLLPPEALTDEYLWATPQFGVPAARRPGTRTPTRGL